MDHYLLTTLTLIGTILKIFIIFVLYYFTFIFIWSTFILFLSYLCVIYLSFFTKLPLLEKLFINMPHFLHYLPNYFPFIHTGFFFFFFPGSCGIAIVIDQHQPPWSTSSPSTRSSVTEMKSVLSLSNSVKLERRSSVTETKLVLSLSGSINSEDRAPWWRQSQRCLCRAPSNLKGRAMWRRRNRYYPCRPSSNSEGVAVLLLSSSIEPGRQS